MLSKILTTCAHNLCVKFDILQDLPTHHNSLSCQPFCTQSPVMRLVVAQLNNISFINLMASLALDIMNIPFFGALRLNCVCIIGAEFALQETHFRLT